MKKKKVIKKLIEIREDIIEQIDKPAEGIFLFIALHKKDSFEYGYKLGMATAATILAEKTCEMFPEEKEDEEPGGD